MTTLNTSAILFIIIFGGSMKTADYHFRLSELRLNDNELKLIGDSTERSMCNVNSLSIGRYDPLVNGATDCLNNFYRFISGFGDSHDIFSDEYEIFI